MESWWVAGPSSAVLQSAECSEWGVLLQAVALNIAFSVLFNLGTSAVGTAAFMKATANTISQSSGQACHTGNSLQLQELVTRKESLAKIIEM